MHAYVYVYAHVHVHVHVACACTCMPTCTCTCACRYVEWAKQAGITILPTWQEYVVGMGDKVDELTKVS